MEYVLQILTFMGIVFLAMFKKNYFPRYLEEKAKNMATKEDIEEITKKIEKIKQEQDVIYSEIRNSRERFNSEQFKLYNLLWSSLIELKISADTLWEKANNKNLRDFIEKLISAKEAIMKSAILIEEIHYSELINLIEKFESFMFGKKKLLELRKQRNIEDDEVEYTIENNRMHKNQYDVLLRKLKYEFVSQLRRGFE